MPLLLKYLINHGVYIYMFVNCNSRSIFISSGDELENERRRLQCLDEMTELEKQFSDIKEQYVETTLINI